MEITNTEHHVVRTQLEGVCQGLEIANVEHYVVRTQLKEIFQGIEYLTGVVYKAYIGSHGSMVGE